jgi:RNA polymerase sigma-70 factor (ECF subfamily)
VEGKLIATSEVRQQLAAHLSRLWRYGLVLSRNRDIAEELVQSTCVRALEKSSQYTPGTRIDRWLFAILHSIWISELRARYVRQGRDLWPATNSSRRIPANRMRRACII